MRRRHSFGQNSAKLWRRAYARQTDAKSIPIEAKLLSAAAALGAMVGLGSIAVSEGGTHRIVSAAHSLAANAGMVRARTPPTGDYWPGATRLVRWALRRSTVANQVIDLEWMEMAMGSLASLIAATDVAFGPKASPHAALLEPARYTPCRTLTRRPSSHMRER